MPKKIPLRLLRAPTGLLLAALLLACAQAPAGGLEELPPLPAEPPALTAQVAVPVPEPVPEPEPEPEPLLLEVLRSSGSHSELLAAFERAELLDLLSLEESEPRTLLAPTDAAFAALSKREQRRLAKPSKLALRLRQHLLVGALDPEALVSRTEVTTLDGDVLQVTATAQPLADNPPDNAALTIEIDGLRLREVIVSRFGRVYIVDALLPAHKKSASKAKSKPTPKTPKATAQDPSGTKDPPTPKDPPEDKPKPAP